MYILPKANLLFLQTLLRIYLLLNFACAFMKRTLLAAILLLSGLRVSAQKLIYTFDYAITMIEESKYGDTTLHKNSRIIFSTLLNKGHCNYIARMRYNADSTQNSLQIIDFKNGKSFIIYTHRKEKGVETGDNAEGTGSNIAIRKAINADPLKNKPDKQIGNYLCEQFYFKTRNYAYETWITHDIKYAPCFSHYAVYGYEWFPVVCKGVPVLYSVKSPERSVLYKLVGTKEVKNKIILRNTQLIAFEGKLSPTIDNE